MAVGMNVEIPPGGELNTECSYSVPTTACGDPADSCCFSYGLKVENQEHCNMFIYYTPIQKAVFRMGQPDNAGLAIDCDMYDPTSWGL